MPFTGSHPAAVLPLLRLGLPPSALVIGSMTPDLPYYLPLRLDFVLSHTARGVVTLDLVLGLVAWLVWHAVLAEPLLAAAPAGLRDRMPAAGRPGLQRRLGSVRSYLAVPAAVMIGAATHVGWDAITHEGRWGPATIDWLAQSHGLFPGYRWAQYASTVLGGVMLAVWLVLWWRRRPARPDPSLPAVPGWVALAAVGLVAVATALGAAEGVIGAPGQAEVGTAAAALRIAAVEAVTHGGAAGGTTAVALALLWQALRPVLPARTRV